MSSDVLDPDFQKLLVADNIQTKPPLCEFYESLNTYNEEYSNSLCDASGENSTNVRQEIRKLCGIISKILDIWDKKYANYGTLSNNKSCDYFNYWLYGKMKDNKVSTADINFLYQAWFQNDNNHFSLDKHNKNVCSFKKFSVFSEEELGNKKKMYDFLEYYNGIREKLNNGKTTQKDKYCDYIKVIFKLYKEMEHNNTSKVYNPEIYLFKLKFLDINELKFLENKCPNKCLKLVFYKNNKTLCPFEEKPEKESVKDELQKCEDKQNTSTNGHLDKMKEYEYIFKKFSSHTTYEELNNNVDIYHYYNICSELLQTDEQDCKSYILCSKLARNFEKLFEMNNEERSNRCEHITNWMYDQFWLIFNNNSNNIHKVYSLGKLLNVGYTILHKLGINDCYYETEDINLEELMEKKYLHDYFKNYDKINCDSSTDEYKCQKYCEYITQINDLYKKYIGECCIHYNDENVSDEGKYFFNCNKNYNPYSVYSKLKCSSILPPGKGIKEEFKLVPIDNFVLWLTDKSHKQSQLLERINTELSSTSDKTCNKLMCDPFYIVSFGSFAIVGMFLLFFILYKFTPLGYWVNKRILKTENEKHYYQENDAYSTHLNSQTQRIRISYH